MDKENVSAPVISTDALFITLVIDVAAFDIPGAFLQTDAKPGMIKYGPVRITFEKYAFHK